MTTDRPERFGGWTADELRQTWQTSTGAGSDTELTDEQRFVRGVVTLVRRRAQLGDESTGTSVFLLSGPASDGLPRAPMLDEGDTPIFGRLWYVNAPVRSGHWSEIEDDDDAVCRSVTEGLGLGAVPAIVVKARERGTTVRFYPSGLQALDDCERVELSAADVTLDDVYQVIDGTYESCLKTPSATLQGNRLWANARKNWPYSDAEHRVQAYLKPALKGGFPTCEVRHEYDGRMGRADLALEEHDVMDRSRVTRLVVIELKILRSFGQKGGPYAASGAETCVQEGVEQAAAYRDEHGHRLAALCCFDMRTEDTGEECFANVRADADNRAVGLKRWFLYSSSRAARRGAWDEEE